MSGSNDIKHFKIKNIETSDVSTVLNFNGMLWIGVNQKLDINAQNQNNGTNLPNQKQKTLHKIVFAKSAIQQEYDDDSKNEEVQEKFNIKNIKRLRIKEESHVIANLIPLTVNETENCLIIHYKKQNNGIGPVDIMYEGGLLNQFCNDARIVMTANTKENKIIIACVRNKNEIQVYKFYGQLIVEDFLIKTNVENITAAAMSDTKIVFCGDKKYFSVDIKNGEKPKEITEMQTGVSIVNLLPQGKFILAYKSGPVIYDPEYPDQVITKTYEDQKVPTMIYANDTTVVQVYDTFVVKSNTEFENQQRYDVGNVKFVCMYQKELLIVTKEDWCMINSVPAPKKFVEMIKESQESKEAAYTQLLALPKNLCLESIEGIFTILWNEERFSEALDLIEKITWTGKPETIFCLFPDLIFTDLCPRKRQPRAISKKQVKFDQSNDSKKYFESLYKSTEKMCNVYSSFGYPPYFCRLAVTVLGELYTICQKTRELDALIQENQNLSIDILRTFIEEGIKKFSFGPAYAVLLTRDGKIEKAMEVWDQLYQNTTSWNVKNFIQNEASFTIREFIGDSTDKQLFIKWLNWLKKENPEAAVNALLSTKHDVDTVLKCIKVDSTNKSIDDEEKEKARKIEIRYLDYIINRQDFKPNKDHLADLFTEYIETLKKIESEEINVDEISFIEASKNKNLTPDEKMKAVKNELLKKTLNLINTYIKDIDVEEFADEAKGLDITELWLCIYGHQKEYEKAFDLLRVDGENDIGKIQKFCREAPDPPSAFTAAFKMIGVDKVFEKKSDLFTDNLPYLDPIETVELIPDENKLRSVSDNIMKLFNLLVQRNEALDKQINIVKNLKVDADYRLSLAEHIYCTVDKTSVCEKCGAPIGSKQFYLGVDGKLYCSNCKSGRH